MQTKQGRRRSFAEHDTHCISHRMRSSRFISVTSSVDIHVIAVFILMLTVSVEVLYSALILLCFIYSYRALSLCFLFISNHILIGRDAVNLLIRSKHYTSPNQCPIYHSFLKQPQLHHTLLLALWDAAAILYSRQGARRAYHTVCPAPGMVTVRVLCALAGTSPSLLRRRRQCL